MTERHWSAMTVYPPGSTPAGGVAPTRAGGLAPTPTAGPLTSSVDASADGQSVDPALCRVSVLSGRTQVDLALPADVPVASLLPELARLLLRNQFGEPERVPDDLAVRWTLARVGLDPLDETRSLVENGIYDGDLLVLRSVATSELPTVYDDVIDAVAGITRREFHSWTSTSARWVGIVTFLVAVVGSGGLVVAASWTDPRYDLAAMAFVAAAVFGVADVLMRTGRHRAVGASLSTATALTVFAGCFAVLPGEVNAANVLLGAGVSALVAVIALRATLGEPFTHLALITVSVLVAVGALVQLLVGWSVRETATVLVVVALVIALIAPRLTILLVRLPIPAVPAAGASLDDIDTAAPSNVNAGVAAIGAVALPETAALELRAKAANAHMSGLMLGAAGVAVVSSTAAAVPRTEFSWQSLVLGLIVSIALVLRGRSHSDLVQASGMIGLGAAGLFATVAVQTVAGGVWTASAVGVGLLIAVACFVSGAITPSMDFSPVLRRIVEVIEYLLIAATVPLAAWVIGVYTSARGL